MREIYREILPSQWCSSYLMFWLCRFCWWIIVKSTNRENAMTYDWLQRRLFICIQLRLNVSNIFTGQRHDIRVIAFMFVHLLACWYVATNTHTSECVFVGMSADDHNATITLFSNSIDHINCWAHLNMAPMKTNKQCALHRTSKIHVRALREWKAKSYEHIRSIRTHG